MLYTIEKLFDLSEFRHAAIFDRCRYPWEALNKISDYLKTIELGNVKEIPGVHLIDPELIFIGKGTVIEPGAYIKGPCVIGENCSIRQGAYIRGDLIAGDRCVIGHDTEVKNSIFLNEANAAHFAYVGDSILGNKVNLGAGTKLANLRFDHEEIVIEKIRTGRKKLGAILGDGTQTGCNSVANPGTVTGKNVKCSPCINFGGFIIESSLIKSGQLPVVGIS